MIRQGSYSVAQSFLPPLDHIGHPQNPGYGAVSYALPGVACHDEDVSLGIMATDEAEAIRRFQQYARPAVFDFADRKISAAPLLKPLSKWPPVFGKGLTMIFPQRSEDRAPRGSRGGDIFQRK